MWASPNLLQGKLHQQLRLPAVTGEAGQAGGCYFSIDVHIALHILSLVWILPLILNQGIRRNKEYCSKIGWSRLQADCMEDKPRVFNTPQNQVLNLWSSLESIWKWWNSSEDGVVALTLEKCYAECAILPPSPATAGAALNYRPQPTPGWFSACPVEIPPNCWCISNKWVQLAKALQLQLKRWEGSYQQPSRQIGGAQSFQKVMTSRWEEVAVSAGREM